MRKKIRLFREFKFFSFKVLFFGLIEYLKIFFCTININLKKKKIKFYINSEMSLIRAVLFGKKEKEVYNFIDKYLNSDDIFFDIGANVGVFSIYSSVFKNAKCIAIEPEFSNLYLLKKNVILNNLTKKIDIYPCSINDSNGLNFLHLSSFESGAALHSISKSEIQYTDEKSAVVMKTGTCSLTLDEFVNQTKIIPTMIKIDTDGKELKILNGAKKTLQHVRYIAMEMPIDSNKDKICFEILQQNNFERLKDLEKDRNLFFIKNQ